MRIDLEIAGEKLIFEQNRRVQVRVELALNMKWSEIAEAMKNGSESVREQMFMSGFSYPDGRLVPEAKLIELMTIDTKAVTNLVERISNMGKPKEAMEQSPVNTETGSESDLIQTDTGNSKTGKLKKPLKVE